MRMNNGLVVNEFSVPSTIILEKPHLFISNMIELSILVRVSCLDFLDTIVKNKDNEVDEINIRFISDLEDISFFHYIAQPKSMLCRKQARNFLEGTLGNLSIIGSQIALDIKILVFLQYEWRQQKTYYVI